MGAFTVAAYVEELASAAKVAIPIVLLVLLTDGWVCRRGPALWGWGVEGFGKCLFDYSIGLSRQLSDICSSEWQ